MSTQKMLDFDKLKAIRESHAQAKIVLCHGVFDVLHAGHLAYFRSAKKYGDILVVTVTSDEYVNKGPGRPYFNANIRANMLAALEIIDFVTINKNPLAVPVIERLQPDFYVKGPDYKDRTADVTGGIKIEENAVEKVGGKLVFTEDEIFSSSTLINKFFNTWTDDQSKIIEDVKSAGGEPVIEKILEKISRQSVVVAGEPIVDTYVFCIPEGISSKSPSVSAKFQYEENYAGGALAIANHLADLVMDVSLLTTHGNEKYFQEILSTKVDPRVKIVDQVFANIPTPRKTRFISLDKSQRIFEITDIRSDQWLHHSGERFSELLRKYHSKSDATVIADFGHGLFEGSVLQTVHGLQGFIALNVQTNSSNLGFNFFTKHKNMSYIAIDTKEARLAYHDRFATPIDLARRLRSGLSDRNASVGMTLGPNGAYFFPQGQSKECFSPAFADSVIDAIGAGDAFFAFTSMLVKVGCPDVMVPFLGNIYAGLKTRIIGNKAAVSRAQLVKAVTAILK